MSQKWLAENLTTAPVPTSGPLTPPTAISVTSTYVAQLKGTPIVLHVTNTLAVFKYRITVVFNKLPRDQVRLACKRFRARLEKVVEVEGAYFE